MNQDELKLAVAQAAADYVLTKIESDSIVGIGTGSTANCFIDIIAKHKHLFAGTVAGSEDSATRLRAWDRSIRADCSFRGGCLC